MASEHVDEKKEDVEANEEDVMKRSAHAAFGLLHLPSSVDVLAKFLSDKIEILTLKEATFFIALGVEKDNYEFVIFQKYADALDTCGLRSNLRFVKRNLKDRKQVKCDKETINQLIEDKIIDVDQFGFVTYISDDDVSKKYNINLYDELNLERTMNYKKPKNAWLHALEMCVDNNEEMITCKKPDFEQQLKDASKTKMRHYYPDQQRTTLKGYDQFNGVHNDIYKSTKAIVKFRVYFGETTQPTQSVQLDQLHQSGQSDQASQDEFMLSFGGNGVLISKNMFLSAKHCFPIAILCHEKEVILRYYDFHFRKCNPTSDFQRYRDAPHKPWIDMVEIARAIVLQKQKKILRKGNAAKKFNLVDVQSLVKEQQKVKIFWLRGIEFIEQTQTNTKFDKVQQRIIPIADPSQLITYPGVHFDYVTKEDILLDVVCVNTTKSFELISPTYLKLPKNSNYDCNIKITAFGSPHPMNLVVFEDGEYDIDELEYLSFIIDNNLQCFYKVNPVEITANGIIGKSWTQKGLSGMGYVDDKHPNIVVGIHGGIYPDLVNTERVNFATRTDISDIFKLVNLSKD